MESGGVGRWIRRVWGAGVLGALLGGVFSSWGEEAPVNPSVIGGVVSPAGDYPWLGALVSAGEEDDLTNAQFCGCVLIEENWILTAAHCLDGEEASEVAVAFGAGDLAGENRVVPTDLIILHPDYKDVLGLNFDIALARLAEPVRDVAPIAMNRDAAMIAAGNSVKVIGWGMTGRVQDRPDRVSRLREADLDVLDRDLVNAPDLLNGRVSDRMVPVGKLDPLVTSYFGDSGGPMISGMGEEARLLGVTSWGMGCFISVLPYSVYTDVIPYLDWIESITRRDRASWENANGLRPQSESEAGMAEAYRLGRRPDGDSLLSMSVDATGLRARMGARPFSDEWEYALDYYEEGVAGWTPLEWDFGNVLAVDGSLALDFPAGADDALRMVRSTQTRREAAGAAMVELLPNLVVSGAFGALQTPLGGGVRVFKISGLPARGDYRISLLSEGGALEYELRSKTGALSDSGEFEGRVDIPLSFELQDVFWLYLVPGESGIDFVVTLDVKEAGRVVVNAGDDSGGDAQGILNSLSPRFNDAGHFFVSHDIIGNNGGNDVFVRLVCDFDSALSLWNEDTLEAVGQSESWGAETPEFYIFNRARLEDTELRNVSLKVINAESQALGSYRLDVFDHEEEDSLSLANEFDLRGLTVRDHTTDTFNDLEFVDRIELLGLGSGTRFVEVTGLESFRPAFALRDLTRDEIVMEFSSAFCYESSVIEFQAVAGRRYEVIVAGSERSLNKNYFLEVSATRPLNPYEGFSTVAESNQSKMGKWMQRTFGQNAGHSAE